MSIPGRFAKSAFLQSFAKSAENFVMFCHVKRSGKNSLTRKSPEHRSLPLFPVEFPFPRFKPRAIIPSDASGSPPCRAAVPSHNGILTASRSTALTIPVEERWKARKSCICSNAVRPCTHGNFGRRLLSHGRFCDWRRRQRSAKCCRRNASAERC